MLNTILIIIGLIIMAISVTVIYDARIIAKKMFSSNETNETTKVLKAVSFLTFLSGAGILYFIV